MLDSDVAKLYGYETKRLLQSMKRNKERFPDSFCFQLTEAEYLKLKASQNSMSLRSQNVTLKEKSSGRGEHRKYMPYVFTEQGIAMLSGLLKNDIAIQVSIDIMNAFVEMRKFISHNAQIFERLMVVEYKMLSYDRRFDEIFDLLQKQEDFKERIFYEGQIYDAHSLMIDLIFKTDKEIIIIDNYIDKTLLDLLSYKKDNVEVKLITNERIKITALDIFKFNEQYPQLSLYFDNSYHDRFIIIDDIVYHLGASLKDLGKKCFAINKMEDKTLLDKTKIYN